MDQVDRLRAALADRYTLDREIGRGGMAYVYRAHDLQHDRDVAIKVLKPELAAALGTERFLREIRIEARLQHPHILPLYDSGVADGFFYYVMPYVAGESLRDLIRREKQLPLSDAIQITKEVADALTYAHAHDVLHRDIKPGNILLSDEHAVVADFGIAKAISEADRDSLTGTGIAVGTPEYMSPEQGSGDGTADRRSDIYALGCVLYEMLAGEPPFSGRSAQSVLARHRQDTPPPLHTVRPGLPPAIESSVERALAKIPADRFPTASAFAASLTAPATTGTSATPAPSRRRVTLALASILVAVVIAAVVLIRRPAPASAARSPIGVVVLPFDNSAHARDSSRAAHVVFSEALDWVPVVHAIDGAALLEARENARSIPLSQLLRGAARLGGSYVVTGAILPIGSGSRVTLEVFAVHDAERVLTAADSAQGSQLEGPIGRLAARSVGALAQRERLDVGASKAAFSCTSSASALGNLLQGQARFWAGDYDAAASSYRDAIEADSSCGLGYLRLSMVDGWRYDYGAALTTIQAGIGRSPALSPRWVKLLRARREFVLGNGENAIAIFQDAVLDDRGDIDARLGLGESLFHYAGYSGHSPADAQAAFERTIQLDSAMAPIYDHLVDLALLAGDSTRAVTYVRGMSSNDPARLAREAAIQLRFGGPVAHAAALNQLRGADRASLSEVITVWTHGSANLPLADTLAMFLTGANRSPDDRRRGAEYRLAILAAEGRWPDALAVWKAQVGDRSFDAWLVHAYLAGYPASEVADPMFAWARSQLAAGTIPDFELPVTEDLAQGFQALVHRAALMGDSTDVLDLLARMKRARPATDLSDPLPASLQRVLEARLALLSSDSTRAVDLLQRALARIDEPYTWYYPLTSMAPERRLLGRLLEAQRAGADAKRWRDSFHNTWSIGDVLFAARSDTLASPAGQ